MPREFHTPRSLQGYSLWGRKKLDTTERLHFHFHFIYRDFPGGPDGKESACNAGGLGLLPGLGKSPGGGHGNPLQHASLEKPHGQRSLVGYSPWGCEESDMTEQLNTARARAHTHTHTHTHTLHRTIPISEKQVFILTIQLLDNHFL